MDTTPAPASRTAPRRGRRALAAAAVCAGLLGGLWAWSGSEGSLASSLRLASALLPEGMALHSEGVQGSLRHGGRIERLDWQQDGLSLQLQALALELDAGRLLHGTLPLQSLQLDTLRGASQASTPSAPLQPLLWPLRVDVRWQIQQLHWQAATPISASALQGHYRFDGEQHQLQLDQLQWAQGRYRGTLQLQARAPMALQARLQGELPAGPSTPLALQAEAEVQGELSGEMDLRAALQPVRTATPGTAPQLRLQARLQAAGTAALREVQASLQAIDLAALWPGAPQTLLNGRIAAQPVAGHAGALWQAELALDNRLTGPWDQGRLPLQSLQARVQHSSSGWQVPTLLARWPGGQVQGQMHIDAQGAAWQGQWQIAGLQPGQWLSTAQGPALSGQVRTTQAQGGALDLQARLRPEGLASAPNDKAPGLQLQARREGPLWTLNQLQLDWAEAHVQAQGRWHSGHHSFDGQAQAQLPGLQAQLGGQLSAQQGQGQWQLDGTDSQRLWAWLQRWPALRAALPPWPSLQVPGHWQARGQWQGGWSSPALQADWHGSWQGSAGRAELQGQAQAGRSKAQPQDWQGQLTQLRARWQAAGQNQSLQLQLPAPQGWQWLGREQRLRWQAQTWQMQGPDGQAALQLQAGEWQAARRPGAWPQARVQATLSALPLRWVQALGLAGLPGDLPNDLLLQGGLQWQQGEQLQVQAWLERSQGDLLIRSDAAQGTRVQAGLRTARAQLNIDGARAALALRWDSEQAGQLEAQLDSRLASSGPLAALWPANAPLSGRVQARLPRIQAWSWLAPPGWRVQGTVDARFEVAGTRSQPRWQGTLQADELALRSAVEGVEFRQGRLRARLQEQALLIDELTLLGAGAQGGELNAQGTLRWQAQEGQEAPHLQTLQMDVQARARALRVTSRADRRLTVSGQARAQWLAGRMRLSGELQADSALFILPDDSTPRLGADVVIAKTQTSHSPPPPGAGPSLQGVPEVQVLLRLGPDFQLQGQGIRTRLAGELQLSSSAASQGLPRLTGEVRTEGGRYKAYGQELEIEQGLLRFAGPYDNPALDILALRPKLSQRVGVRVTGTAQAPRVRLYAEPEMADADTLAWLVLGRSAAAGGAESALLQQAALALLGGNGRGLGGELASALGLDEISLTQRHVSTTDGNTVSGAAVSLGKRLSKDFYLAYESGVSGTFGSLFVFYELSRQLSLRAQAGEYNALDLVYTIRHD